MSACRQSEPVRRPWSTRCLDRPGEPWVAYDGLSARWIRHLFSCVNVTEGGSPVGAALYWHGAIVIARLPAHHGLDAAGMAAVSGRLRYQ